MSWVSWKKLSIHEFTRQREVLLITVLGALLRLYDLGGSEFFGDEAFNIKCSVEVIRSLQGGEYDNAILSLLSHIHPPIEVLAPIPSLILLGVSEFSARFSSVIVGSLTLYVVYILVEKLHDRRIALLAASIFAICGVHVMYSRVSVSHVYQLFFVCLSLNLSIRGNLMLTFLMMGMAFLCNYPAVFSLLPLVFLLRLRSERIHIKHLIPFLLVLLFYTSYIFAPLIFREYFTGINQGINYILNRRIGRWTPNFLWIVNFINYSGIPYFFFVITGIIFLFLSNELQSVQVRLYALWILPEALFYTLLVQDPSAGYAINLWVPLTILGCLGWMHIRKVLPGMSTERLKTTAIIISSLVVLSTVAHVYARTIRVGSLPFQISPDSHSYQPYKEGWKTTGYFMRKHSLKEDRYACVADGYITRYYFNRKHHVPFEDNRARWWITQDEVFDPRFQLAAVAVLGRKILVFVYYRYWSKPVLVLDISTYDRLFDEEYGSVSRIL